MRLTALTFLLLLILGDAVRSEWEMVCVEEDPDYVALAGVVASYGLATSVRSATGELSATGGSSSLTVRADSRQALINGVRHWLSYPVREAEGGLAISRVDVTRTLAPALRPEAVSGLDPVTTVVLDAGHGGHDGGALSPFGDEKDFALDVVGRVRKKLEAAGLKVVQSRDSDVCIPSRPVRPWPENIRTRSSSAFISMPPVGGVQQGWKSSPSRRRARHQPDNGSLSPTTASAKTAMPWSRSTWLWR